MFSKRRSFSQNYKFDRRFLEKLVSDLREANFKSITIKLPHNLINNERDEIEIQEFLDSERNYPSVILIAKNNENGETLKILFVNTSTKASFKDNTFPSGHIEPPELYVQSPDPARTYALFEFFYDYLKGKKIVIIFSFLLWLFFYIASCLFLMWDLGSLILTRSGVLSGFFNVSSVFDWIARLLAIFLIFQFFSYDTGLYIKEKENKYISIIRRTIRGEFRDNPIVNLVITVIGGAVGTILATIILKKLKIL